MALKAETHPRVPMIAGEPPHPLPDRKPQFLDTAAGPDGAPGERMVVLFESDYLILLDAARDNLADAEAAIEAAKVMARLESGEERPIPFAEMQRITAGENPIKVLREWGNLTQADLARAVGTTAPYISQLETGAARGGRDMLNRIAEVLGVPADLLVRPAAADRQSITEMVRRVTGEVFAGSEADIAVNFLISPWTHGKRDPESGHSAALMMAQTFQSQGGQINHRITRRHLRDYIEKNFPGRLEGGIGLTDIAVTIAARTGWTRSQAETFIDSMSNDHAASMASIARSIGVNQGRLHDIVIRATKEPLPDGAERLIEGLRARGFLAGGKK